MTKNKWINIRCTEQERQDIVEINTEEWDKKFYTIDSDFRVYKVKDHSLLAIGEKIGFLSVVDVADHPTDKGGVQE